MTRSHTKHPATSVDVAVHPETATATTAITKEIPMIASTVPTSVSSGASTATSNPTPVATTGAASAPATTASPVVSLTTPPAVSLPSVPNGWSAIGLAEFRGAYPLTTEIVAIPPVVAELTGSTLYASTFGSLAPDLAKLLSALGDAGGWSNVRMALDAYLAYAKVQEAIAWQVARPQLEDLKSLYDVAVKQSTEVATEFPALNRLLNVRSGIAQRSATTKKRVQKAKAKAAATATSTAPATVTATPAAIAAVTPMATANTAGTAAH